MGMFGLDFAANESQLNSTGFVYTEEADAYMESFEGIECFEEPEFAFARLALESATNFHNLTMAIAIDEMNTLISTNEEMVYEASKFSSIFDKVKKAIKNAWEKVKGVFKKVMNTIAGWIQTDKKFVEKHKKMMNKFKGTVTVKGYNFTHLEEEVERFAIAAFDKALKVENGDPGNLDDITAAAKNVKDNFADVMRANCIPGYSSKTLESGKFTVELNKYFRNGKEDASDVKFTKADAEKLLHEIESCKSAKAAAKASYEATKKFFNYLEKEANSAQKNAEAAVKTKADANKADKTSKAVGKFISACNQAITISHTMMNAHVANINAAHSQAKKVVNAVASGENKEEKVEESALESVVFI